MDVEKENVIKNKNEAIKMLNNYLDTCISIDSKHLKKANLISYWLKDYIRYIENEETFSCEKLKKYSRGDIIKVNLGFNIGNEEGGLHYCIVLDKANALSSGTLTVIPLTSIKENKKYNNSTLNLGNEVYMNLKKICDNMSQKLSEEYENIWKLPAEKVEQFNVAFKYIKKVEKEISKMKKGSIALISQITTISKQRIYDPKNSSDILSNLRVSNHTLDLIDSKIKELFLK